MAFLLPIGAAPPLLPKAFLLPICPPFDLGAFLLLIGALSFELGAFLFGSFSNSSSQLSWDFHLRIVLAGTPICFATSLKSYVTSQEAKVSDTSK